MSHEQYNESTDLANLRLKLRGGLEFELQEHGDTRCYVIQDQTSSNYFQIGLPEYAFLSVLDGRTSLQGAIEETSGRLGEQALTIRDAVRISHWLLQEGLANAVDETGVLFGNSEQLLEQTETQAQQQFVSQLNPLFLRLPLGSPQAFIKAISPLFGWVCSIPFLAIWIAVVAFAIARVMQQPAELVGSAQGLFTSNAWMWMLVTLVGLKLVHEIAHGLFCYRFGGSVKETGIVFILLIPMPFVDVSSCWSFSSKWKRIAVSAAGMYVEIFFAAVAAIVWSMSHDPVLKFHLFNVMLLGSLTTLLFNANFLMRFDGYYMLADFLEIPNLYQKGQQFVNRLGRRFILGKKANPDQESLGRSTTIRVYGIGALIWRVLICVSLTILATALLYGFGMALAIVGVVLWVGTPAWRLLSSWQDPAIDSRPNFKWMSLVTVPVASGFALAMFYVPWPVQVAAPAIVEFDSPSYLRADAAGFVKAVYVREGQSVGKGDLLVELENRQLVTRLRDLELERKKSLIRSRGHHQNREIAAYQSENNSRQATEQQIAEVKQQLNSLRLIANADGIVVGEDLENLTGQFVPTGSSLLRIIDENQKAISVSVSQDHFETFSANQSSEVLFVPRFGMQRVAGILNSVQPTATSTADVRLTSFSGGSLTVRPTNASRANSSDRQSDSLELVSPRFVGTVMVDKSESTNLRVGSVGDVRLAHYDRTIAQHLIVSTRRWLATLYDAIQN